MLRQKRGIVTTTGRQRRGTNVHTNCEPTPCVATPVAASRNHHWAMGGEAVARGEMGGGITRRFESRAKGISFSRCTRQASSVEPLTVVSGRSLFCRAAHCCVTPLTVLPRRALFCRAAPCSIMPRRSRSMFCHAAYCSTAPLTVLPCRSLFCRAASLSLATLSHCVGFGRCPPVFGRCSVCFGRCSVCFRSPPAPSGFGRRRRHRPRSC